MKTDIKINQLDKNGKRNGIWKFYYASNPSKLLYIGAYNKDGWKHGLWEYYYDNGQLSSKGELKKEKQIGLWYEAKYDN